MKWQTEIIPIEKDIEITYSQSLMLIGSCFTESMGARFIRGGFSCCLNPFGILFNPISIARSLLQIIENIPITKEDLVWNNGLWHSFHHHGRFSRTDQDECLFACNNALTDAHSFLKQADIVIITWGTAYAYLTEEGKVVANCHKLPADYFRKKLFETDEITTLYHDVLRKLKDFNPTLKILFTVSPIRHWKDGYRQNQISKSILHLAVHRLQNEFSHINYFPSYEIVMDELRDYRFYAEDMLHIRNTTQDYIWEKLQSTYFSKEARQVVQEVEQFHKLKDHRPLHEDKQPEHESRIKGIIGTLMKRYPFLKLTGRF